MSSWEDTYDIGGDGVPDDFDSVMDFDDGTDAGADVGSFDADATLGDLVAPGPGADVGALSDTDAWIVDLDLGGLADVADIAVVAGVEDVGLVDGDAAARPDVDDGRLAPPLLAHGLTDVPDGADPFAALVGRRLDDDELRNEIRHLRLKPPFEAAAAEGDNADAVAAHDESVPG